MTIVCNGSGWLLCIVNIHIFILLSYIKFIILRINSKCIMLIISQFLYGNQAHFFAIYFFLWRGFLTLWETIIIPSKNHEISHIVCKKYLCNLLFFTLWQHYRVCVGRCSLWRPYSNSLLRNHPIFFIDSVMISWGEFLVFFYEEIYPSSKDSTRKHEIIFFSL